jgi:hypothetical protein
MQAGFSLKTIIILFLALGLSISSAADDGEAPEIQTLMAPDDFSASGLDKLTDAERAHLSDWVARYREGAIKGPPVPGKQREEAAAEVTAARETTEVAAEDTGQATTDEYPGSYTTEEQKKKDSEVKYELVAKIVPSFRGWSGKTVFTLDNGQVWRQRTPGSLRYSGSDSTVIITQNMIGKFIMKHLDTGRSVGVRRID